MADNQHSERRDNGKHAEAKPELAERKAEEHERGEIDKAAASYNDHVKAYKTQQKETGKSKATGAGADAFGKGGLASAKDLLGDLAHDTLTKDAQQRSNSPQRQAELIAEIKRDGYRSMSSLTAFSIFRCCSSCLINPGGVVVSVGSPQSVGSTRFSG